MASAILIVFWLTASVSILLASVCYILAPNLPQFVQDILLYGKARGKRKKWTLIQLLEVPKSWFIHFYAVGTLVNGLMTILTLAVYLSGFKPPSLLTNLVELVNYGSTHTVNTDSVSTVLLIGMMFVQNIRRLLESLYISVYSSSTINLAHYLLGIILYSTFPLAVLCEAPALNQINGNILEFVKIHHVTGLVLFGWASWHHSGVHVQLANLRKDPKGIVTSQGHYLPSGGWFTLVSCPHYLMEVLIYTAFAMTAGWHHYTVWSVVIFVYSNQLVAAVITHRWYKDKFKEEFPQNRRALIPYLL